MIMKIVKEMIVLIVAYWVPTELFIITLGRKISAHAEARVPLVQVQLFCSHLLPFL